MTLGIAPFDKISEEQVPETYFWPEECTSVFEFIHRISGSDEVEDGIIEKIYRRYKFEPQEIHKSHILQFKTDIVAELKRKSARREEIVRTHARIQYEDIESGASRIILGPLAREHRQRQYDLTQYEYLFNPGQSVWFATSIYWTASVLLHSKKVMLRDLAAFLEDYDRFIKSVNKLNIDLCTLTENAIVSAARESGFDDLRMDLFQKIWNDLHVFEVYRKEVVVTKVRRGDVMLNWLVTEVAKGLRSGGCKQPVPFIDLILQQTLYRMDPLDPKSGTPRFFPLRPDFRNEKNEAKRWQRIRDALKAGKRTGLPRILGNDLAQELLLMIASAIPQPPKK